MAGHEFHAYITYILYVQQCPPMMSCSAFQPFLGCFSHVHVQLAEPHVSVYVLLVCNVWACSSFISGHSAFSIQVENFSNMNLFLKFRLLKSTMKKLYNFWNASWQSTELLQATFPDFTLRPKHHYIEHYPHLIKKFGPLTDVWTMRFEGKHKFFKRSSWRVPEFRKCGHDSCY